MPPLLRTSLVGLLVLAGSALAQPMSLDEIRGLTAADHHDEALAALETYLDGRPSEVEALLLKGVILTRLGKTNAAIETFQFLARSQPKLPEPHNNLAVLYAAQSRYEDARGALQKAIELQPSYDIAHENLGDIYAKLASLSYQRAADLNPDNARARNKAASMAGSFEPEPAPSADPPPTAPVASAAEPSTAASLAECVELTGVRDAAQANAIAAWAEQRGIASRVRGGEGGRVRNYLVYLPSLGSRDAAAAEVARLRQHGITDLALIPRGADANGVALGVYSKEESAKRRTAQLTALGYQPKVAPRYREPPGYVVHLVAGMPVAVDAARGHAGVEPRSAPCE